MRGVESKRVPNAELPSVLGLDDCIHRGYQMQSSLDFRGPEFLQCSVTWAWVTAHLATLHVQPLHRSSYSPWLKAPSHILWLTWLRALSFKARCYALAGPRHQAERHFSQAWHSKGLEVSSQNPEKKPELFCATLNSWLHSVILI